MVSKRSNRPQIDPAALEKALRRVMQRRAGNVPPPASDLLPLEKSRFPKLLCLDMNKWVELGRSHLGLACSPAATTALAAIRAGIAAGKVVVPITGTNATELGFGNDPSRRQRLAEFMVDLSNNQSLMSSTILGLVEFRNAISTHLCGASEVAAVRPTILHRGVHFALAGASAGIETGDISLNNTINAALLEPELSTHFLTHSIDRSSVVRLRELERLMVSEVEAVRAVDADLDPAAKRRLELRTVLTAGRYASLLREVLAGLDIPEDRFDKWVQDDKHLDALVGVLPGLDTHATVLLRRDRNPQHRTHEHDSRDLEFMKVAVPYANIVVMERTWAHFVRQSRLDRRFDTIVLNRLTDLPQALINENCA